MLQPHLVTIIKSTPNYHAVFHYICAEDRAQLYNLMQGKLGDFIKSTVDINVLVNDLEPEQLKDFINRHKTILEGIIESTYENLEEFTDILNKGREFSLN